MNGLDVSFLQTEGKHTKKKDFKANQYLEETIPTLTVLQIKMNNIFGMPIK